MPDDVVTLTKSGMEMDSTHDCDLLVRELFAEICTAMAKTSTNEWSDPHFSKQKAYVSALHAQLAYASIAEFELRRDARIKVLPSSLHNSLVARTCKPDLTSLAREANGDGVDIFSVSNQGAVAVGVRTRDVVFVAIRGTASLMDVVIDLQMAKLTPYRRSQARFHGGFYSTIADLRWSILLELRKWGSKLPLVITGHSLGGAMAAILSGMPEFHRYLYPYRTASSYTFGMPRYGNKAAMSETRYPYHIYNQADPVPRVPPAFLGYPPTLANEFCLQSGLVEGCFPPKVSIFACRPKQHQMETYLDNLNVLINL